MKSTFFITLGLVSIFWSGDRDLFPQNRGSDWVPLYKIYLDLDMQFD